MSTAGCARTASELTTLVQLLGRARTALVRQSRLPEEEFGGLSGDAYRRHAVRSAATVAGAASDLALLAGALTALGRQLAAAEEIRGLAAGSPPERARELRARAHDVEHRALHRWRDAVAAYEGRVGPAHQPVQRPIGQPVVPGTLLRPVVRPAPPAASVPAAAPTPAPGPVAPAAIPAVASPPEPVLDSALVIPSTGLEFELLVPATPAPHCGTVEAIDEHR